MQSLQGVSDLPGQALSALSDMDMAHVCLATSNFCGDFRLGHSGCDQIADEFLGVHASNNTGVLRSAQALCIAQDKYTCNMQSVGDRVKEVRLELGIEQPELARRIGVTQGAISHLENDVRKGSTILIKLANLAGVEAMWLAEGEGPKRRGDTPPTVTSLKSPEPLTYGALSPDEALLVDAYRAAGEEARAMLIMQAKTLLKPPKKTAVQAEDSGAQKPNPSRRGAAVGNTHSTEHPALAGATEPGKANQA